MHVIRSEQQGSWQLSKLSCHLSRGRASAQQVCALTSVTADTASSVTRPVKQSIHTISITLQNKDTIPASMSEMVTVISDAAANDAATTIGGGVAPKRAARRGKNHIFAQGESAGCTIRRHALQILVSDSMFAFVCGLFYITYFALVGRTKSLRGPLLVLQRAQCAAGLCTTANVWHAGHTHLTQMVSHTRPQAHLTPKG